MQLCQAVLSLHLWGTPTSCNIIPNQEGDGRRFQGLLSPSTVQRLCAHLPCTPAHHSSICVHILLLVLLTAQPSGLWPLRLCALPLSFSLCTESS
jgi:hypothetical protein